MARVITTGKFVVTHEGHWNLLNFCRTLAGPSGEVIVILDSDSRIQKRDGHYPTFTYQERAAKLLCLKCWMFKMVDDVVMVNTDEELSTVIMNAEADFLVKGSEWQGKNIIGAEFTNLVFFKSTDLFDEKLSSTMIKERLNEKNKL